LKEEKQCFSSFGFPSKCELRKFFETLLLSLYLPMFTLIGSLNSNF